MSSDLSGLRIGEFVQVRSEAEIRATLDENGMLNSLPFMPEMLKFCGKTYRIFRFATITCVEGAGMRGMKDTVFLEGVRCDGGYHDGCQRLCLIFWKRQWLRRVQSSATQSHPVTDVVVQPDAQAPYNKTKEGDTYICQSTELRKATNDAAWWDIRRDIAQIKQNGQSILLIIKQALIAIHVRVYAIIRRVDYVRLRGNQSNTPREHLGLQAGDWVMVRSLEEIKQTLDSSGRNRGLELLAEMIPFCNKRLRVLNRVERIILEITGKMQKINDSVVLEGSSCDGYFHRGCPRNNLFLWREIWLRRIDDGEVATPSQTQS